MITQTERIVGRESGLRGQIAGFAATAVTQGLVFGALVPILRALLAGDVAAALPWTGLAAAAAAASGALLWFTSNRGFVVGVEKVGDPLMRRIGAHVLRLPLGWFTSGRSGQVTTLVTTSTTQITNVPAVFLQQMTIAILTPLTVVAVTLLVDWRLALALLAVLPVALLLYRAVKRAMAPAQQLEDRSQAEVADRVLEFARAQPVLRAAGRTEDGWNLLDRALTEDRRAVVASLNRGQAPLARFSLAVDAAFALVTLLGVYLVLGGTLNPADLIAVLILAVRFTEPLSQVGGYGSGVRMAENALKDIDEVLDTRPLSEPERPEEPADHSVELRGVRFGYGDRTVLDGVDLSCPAGTVTALVGPSGSGKTTVTRMVARFWDVQEGQVLIGGVDVRDIPAEGLMGRIAMVFQEVHLFDGTIEENVRLGRPDATEEQVRDAAAAARLDEVVERLPHGWETPVGEGGARLSGGERQRVSIARALLKDAPIVLLDEATAALDAENEAAVGAALDTLAADRTVLVIAHRLSTVAGADQIAVLDGGRIGELGTHAELVGAGGLYARFWNERHQASRWRITPEQERPGGPERPEE